MFTKTLIVCLLALFCLQLTLADRLETRIAGSFFAVRGQFPYIAYLSYNYLVGNVTQTYIATGIIYSVNSVITTANVFNKFPTTGGVLSVSVGASDSNLPLQFFQFNATIGLYTIPTNGATPPATPPNEIILPSQFVQNSSTWDIAIIRVPSPAAFNFSSFEVGIANFPTSSPLPTDTLYAVAYGNQNPGGPTFPELKFTRMFLKYNNKCVANFSANGVNRPFNFSQNFCVQSRVNASANFEGVCAKDIGGALVRTGDVSNTSAYYEVLGLISYANDITTCNAVNPVPAIIIYLSIYQNNFFTPILGSLASVGNKQNPALNTNSGKGNFICGNGKIDTVFEKCDPTDPTANLCCNPNTCAYRPSGYYCGPKPKPGDKPNKCLTRLICDNNGTCATRNKPGNRRCNGRNTRCVNGACVSTVTV
jgi:hypothetical protein